MPGGDGTGPNGLGPMTGGGFGWCRGFGRYFRRRRIIPKTELGNEISDIRETLNKILERLDALEKRK